MHAISIGRTHRALAAATVVAISVGACSGDDDGSDEAEESMSELEADATAGEIGEALDSAGGETVDDVEIVFAPGSDSLRVGGLDIALDGMNGYAEIGTDILLPPDWPTLSVVPLLHADPANHPDVTVAVFAQTTLVTEADSRSALFERFWSVSQADDGETLHASTTEGDGVTCHAEVRRRAGVAGDVEFALVLFAGPGLASSALGVFDARAVPDAGDTVAAAVESACGTRPDGL